MGVVDGVQLLIAARQAPLDAAAALRLAAYAVDCGGRVSGVPDAAVIFRRLLTLDPAGLGWSAWGRLLNSCDDAVSARPLLRRATRASPQRAQTWSDYANAMQKLKSPLARTASQRALALAPAAADYLFNVGCDSQETDRLDEAERLLRWARLIVDAEPEIWARAAALALLRGDMEQARERAARALALAPASASAMNAWGMRLARSGGRRRAAVWLARAARAQPDFVEARFNLSLEKLQDGRLVEGWGDYELRFASRGYVEESFSVRRWRGEPLAGKRLFLWREQGVGDEILFSSCFADAQRAAAFVAVSCDRRLLSLFSRSFPSIRFAPDGEKPDRTFDYQAPIGSLPGACRRSLVEFPACPAGWLRPDPAATAAWRQRVAALPPGLNVGLAWTSGLRASDRMAAYTALADWGPLFEMPGVNLINLQYGRREDEIAAAEQRFGKRLHRWDDLDLKDDFEQVAGLLTALDVVICPATAVGELAAALGVCVWRLGEADWTFLGASARPWFPAQRIFPTGRDWPAAALPRRIAAELATYARPHPAVLNAPAWNESFDEALRRYQGGDLAGAAAQCALALRAPEANDRVRHLAAVIANRRGLPEEAVQLLAATAGRAGADQAMLATLCAACKQMGLRALAEDRLAAADRLFRVVAALDPCDRGGLVNLGSSQVKAGSPAAAARTLGWALRLNPDDADGWCNYAVAQENLECDAKAEAGYRKALVVDSTHGNAHNNLGMLLLKRGALREGYAEYDWRFRTPHFDDLIKPTSAPLWRGENIAGKTLFVWREQGLGDEIMFARSYGDLAGRAGRVVVQCDRRLVGLFSRSFPQLRFIPDGVSPPSHDVQIPAGTLLRRLRASLDRFPSEFKPLVVDPARARTWRARLDALGPGLKVGLAWRSALINSGRRPAYIDACDWAPVLRTPGVHFISLQYGDVAKELAQVRNVLNIDIINFDDLNLKDDLEGAAALMSVLDLTMTTAMSAGELSAAVGAPTWRLAVGDWTSLGAAVRPAYPTMRLWPPRAGRPLSATPVLMGKALRGLANGLAKREATTPAAAVRSPATQPRLTAARDAFAAGRVAAAVELFASVLRDDRLCSGAWIGLGACHAEAGDNAAAETALRRGLSLAPADAAALTTMGNMLAASGRCGRAASAHRRAVRVVPSFAPAWNNLGVVLLAQGQDAESAACHRRALADMSASPGVWGNLAAALRSLGQFAQARRALDLAMALNPADPGIFAGLTRLLRLVDAQPALNPWMRRAVRLAPDFPAVAFNHGLELLGDGRLAEGWAGYERRFDAAELAFAKPALSGAPWRGESLAGKRLLVWGEQGVGDQLLFASLLPDLLDRAARDGGRVALAFDPRLGALLAGSFPAADIVADIGEPGRVDYHCGAGSLAAHFRRRLADFPPRPGGYLTADPACCALWRRRVDALPAGLRVGVAWRSGLITGERRAEYFELMDLAELLRMPGVTAVNLLYDAEMELAAAQAVGLRLYGWPDLDLKNDFSSVAALIAQLDLVIAPATSVGELSAALGTPTWRLALAGDWTRLGAAARPWHTVQSVMTPAPGESIHSLSRRVARRLAILTQ